MLAFPYAVAGLPQPDARRSALSEACAKVGGMKTIDSRISLADLRAMAEEGFGDMVKAVVDLERGILAVVGALISE